MSFSDLCHNNYTTPDDLIRFLKINYPNEFPLHQYNYIYTLCSGCDRDHRRKLVKTLFEFYNHNPIDINKDIILPIITFLEDEQIFIYMIELCTRSNYAPIIFTQGIMNHLCFANLFGLLKYIINLPTKFPQYQNINGSLIPPYLKHLRTGSRYINFNELITCVLCSDETKLTENEFAYYLYKTAIKNKFTIDYTTEDSEFEFYEDVDNTPLLHQYGIVCFNDKIRL